MRETERAEAFQFRKKQLKFSSPMTLNVRFIDMKQFLTSPGSLHFDEKAYIGRLRAANQSCVSSTIETEVDVLDCRGANRLY